MDQLVNFIIRPPRAFYCPEDDLLDQEFMLKGRCFYRMDLEVTNSRGKKLQCSHYKPLVVPEGKALPCVIYCHGNSGCRADASEAAVILLPSNITVFALDFSGSGLSEGEHVTLGWNEKDDLRAVVDYLRTNAGVSCIGLWGRSMGAVTSLMYGAEDPSIAGMVLDSPFSNLVDLMMDLVDTYRYPIPKFTVKLAIQHMRRIIKKKANFDIMDLDAIQVAKCSFVPVLIGHGADDDFIHPRHSDRIYDFYMGDKNIIKFDGDHNSPRPQFFFDSLTIFFHNVLNPPKVDEVYSPSMQDIFLQDKWDTLHALGNKKKINLGGLHQELATTSMEDTIADLRSRRPMSRTDVPHDVSYKQEQSETEEDESSRPSSSSLDTIKISNGQTHEWLTQNARDDDYLEYTFDGYSDIPCSIEDEERMIMEAMIESLKNVELGNPEEKCNADYTSEQLDAKEKCNADYFSEQLNTKEKCSGESTVVSCPALDTKLATPGCAAKTDTKLHDQHLQETETGIKLTNDNGSEVVIDKDFSTIDSSSSNQDTGTTGTKATLVVQKNSTGNFIEELAQRWCMNIFKSR